MLGPQQPGPQLLQGDPESGLELGSVKASSHRPDCGREALAGKRGRSRQRAVLLHLRPRTCPEPPACEPTDQTGIRTRNVNLHSFIHSFLPHIFAKHLLCTRCRE